MPYVELSRYHGKRLYLSDEDLTADGRGYMVTKHWIAWVGFVLEMIVMFVLFGGFLWLGQFLGADITSRTSVVVIGIAVLLMAKWAWVAYMALAKAYLLITPANVFSSRMEYWFKHVVDPFSVGDVSLRTRSYWTAGFPDIRRVFLNTEGDSPDVEFTLAAGGDEIAVAWQRLTAATKD